jgi:hypothetical protein
MARGKRALFEVIQKDKRFQRTTPVQAVPIQAAPIQAAASQAARAPVAPAPAAGPVLRAAPAAAAPVVVKKVKAPRPPGPSVKERILKAYREGRARLQPRVDRWRPHVIEHGGVVVGVLAAVTLIGIVEIVRRAAHPATARPAMIASMDEVRAQPANPSVLQIEPTSTAVPAQVAEASGSADAPAGAAGGTDDAYLSADAAAARPASSVFTPGNREVNLNYLLIQSYGDQKTAQEACDFLNNGGVPSTIERGVDGWRGDFYLVVGLQGFPRVSGAEYEAYRQKIDALSAEFAPPHSYKRFDPIAIKWEKTE